MQTQGSLAAKLTLSQPEALPLSHKTSKLQARCPHFREVGVASAQAHPRSALRNSKTPPVPTHRRLLNPRGHTRVGILHTRKDSRQALSVLQWKGS